MSDSLHDNLLREKNKNALKKYEVLNVLGTGSMGTVSMVKIKDSKIGGSAFKSSKGLVGKALNKLFKKQASSIPDSSERRKVDNLYALKSIQLDRVKPLYVEELKNEIEILKSTDHPNIVKAYEVSLFAWNSFCARLSEISVNLKMLFAPVLYVGLSLQEEHLSCFGTLSGRRSLYVQSLF